MGQNIFEHIFEERLVMKVKIDLGRWCISLWHNNYFCDPEYTILHWV